MATRTLSTPARGKQTAKPRRAAPRRVYYGPDKMRAAWLAGNGKSLSDIATMIGGTTRKRMHALLSKCGLGTLPKRPNEVAFPVIITRPEFERMTGIAIDRATEPTALAALLLRTLLSEPVVLQNLLDDAEAEEQALAVAPGAEATPPN